MRGNSGLAQRNISERGSEIVQSVVVMPLVLLVVFSVVQVGGMMLSIDRLTADLTRACQQLDVAGLVLAANKEQFVASEILGASTQLQGDSLRVEHVSLTLREEDQAASMSGGSSTSAVASPSITQRSNLARVSFRVAYELPSVALVPGLAQRTIARQVVCEHLEGRVIEVAVTP